MTELYSLFFKEGKGARYQKNKEGRRARKRAENSISKKTRGGMAEKIFRGEEELKENE